jgi:hypothetical protein
MMVPSFRVRTCGEEVERIGELGGTGVDNRHDGAEAF